MSKIKFEDLNINLNLLKSIYGLGWEYPSDIQVKGIPAILTKSDVILQAQSGMGKTGCFSIGLLQSINPEEASVQGIVVSPTRELAKQTYEVIYKLSEELKINVILYIGGENKDSGVSGVSGVSEGNRNGGRERKTRSLLQYEDRATIFVGTPGKLSDIIRRKLFTTQKFNVGKLIIDEFDELLKENFHEAMKTIINETEGNIILCSATRNEVIDDFITNNIMTNGCIEITINNEEVSLDGIDQYKILLQDEHNNFSKNYDAIKKTKLETILDLFNSFTTAQTIIFVNTKNDVSFLEYEFNKRSFPVSTITGDMTQSDRNKVIEDFRLNKSRILLATGIISRGIDVNTVSFVINFELPRDSSEYIHRIGRTGRYGKKGLTICLIGHYNDLRYLEEIENKYKIKVKELPDLSTLSQTYS